MVTIKRLMINITEILMKKIIIYLFKNIFFESFTNFGLKSNPKIKLLLSQ